MLDWSTRGGAAPFLRADTSLVLNHAVRALAIELISKPQWLEPLLSYRVLRAQTKWTDVVAMAEAQGQSARAGNTSTRRRSDAPTIIDSKLALGPPGFSRSLATSSSTGLFDFAWRPSGSPLPPRLHHLAEGQPQKGYVGAQRNARSFAPPATQRVWQGGRRGGNWSW